MYLTSSQTHHISLNSIEHYQHIINFLLHYHNIPFQHIHLAHQKGEMHNSNHIPQIIEDSRVYNKLSKFKFDPTINKAII